MSVFDSSSFDLGPARAQLRERFGHADFRGRQAEAVAAVLVGRDVLLTMPTGSGKSLAYQLPALLLDGLTLVISPLIALMQDQVDALRALDIPAAFVNSSLEAGERPARLEAAARGGLRLLYITPERFRSADFIEFLPRLRVVRLAVDEAHCASQWGHDFRPDYSRLAEYRARVGAPPTIALTATATPQVAEDIVQRARQELVKRLDGYQVEHPELLKAVVDFIQEKMMPIIQRYAVSGRSMVNTEDTLFEDPVALAMLIDIFSERGFRASVDIRHKETPVRFDLETGLIETCKRRIYRITILFSGSKIRRG